MKKSFSSLLILLMMGALLTIFSGCSNLKLSNLNANRHFKSANKYYAEEKYRKAAEEYEKALTLNPNLSPVFFYLGSSYSMLFKPGDESDKNIQIGNKAKSNLEKALQLNPGKRDVIMMLGKIFDQMRDFENAEKYFLQVLNMTPNDPNSYYVMADFYASNNKIDQAVSMYEKRIALNPKDPEGYFFLAVFYQNRRNWEKAVENHQLRIKYIEESNMEEKAKKALLLDAYYRLGHVYWNWSFQTAPDMMSPGQRVEIVQNGMDMLKKVSDIDPNNPDPWIYMSLLYREKAKAEPLKEAEYLKEAEALRVKYMDLRQRKLAADQFMKDLEKGK